MKIISIIIAFFTLSLAACHTGSGKGTENPDKSSKSGQSGELTDANQKKETNTVKTIHLTEAEFLTKVANYNESPNEWKYLGDKPCLIDFYADWCAPCKMIAPILEELAAEYEGKIYIYKIDTEKELGLSSAFGIRSIPTLLFIPQTEAPQIAQGALPKQELKRIIEEVLLGGEIF